MGPELRPGFLSYIQFNLSEIKLSAYIKTTCQECKPIKYKKNIQMITLVCPVPVKHVRFQLILLEQRIEEVHNAQLQASFKRERSWDEFNGMEGQVAGNGKKRFRFSS